MSRYVIEYEKYLTQKEVRCKLSCSLPILKLEKIWKAAGFYVILAQYTDDAVLVYQAYNCEIADYAVKHQKHGTSSSFPRPFLMGFLGLRVALVTAPLE